jgi:[ribosomal protein S5]-alanine N-acetyltransferase
MKLTDKTPAPFIEGDRIILRALIQDDINGDYVDWLNDAEVNKYNSHHYFPYSKSSAYKYIENVNNSSSVLVLAIIEKKSNMHIGNISLQQIDFINRTAEFAILIGDKKSWGKGYSREAGKLIINHGFVELNLNRIYCGTASENIGMRKLAESLKMIEEGIRKEALFKGGNYIDIVEFGVLKKHFIINE